MQLIEKGNTNKLPKSLAVHPDLTSTYKTRKYPNIKRILPINHPNVESGSSAMKYVRFILLLVNSAKSFDEIITL